MWIISNNYKFRRKFFLHANKKLWLMTNLTACILLHTIGMFKLFVISSVYVQLKSIVSRLVLVTSWYRTKGNIQRIHRRQSTSFDPSSFTSEHCTLDMHQCTAFHTGLVHWTSAHGYDTPHTIYSLFHDGILIHFTSHAMRFTCK